MEQQYYFTSTSFGTEDDFRKIRAKHIFKTVELLLLQFLFTFGLIIITAFNQLARQIMYQNASNIFIVGTIGGFASIIYMSVVEKNTKLQLALFTLFQTMIICVATMMCEQNTILMAIFMTIGIICGLGTYALTTANNHTGWIMTLSPCLATLLVMNIVNILMGSAISRMFELVFATLVFFGYIVFDVQYFLSKHSNVMLYNKNNDLHIRAALNIYLDGLNIFMQLLKFFHKKKKSD